MKAASREVLIVLAVLGATIILALGIVMFLQLGDDSRLSDVDSKTVALENRIKSIIKRDIEFEHRIISDSYLDTSIASITQRLREQVGELPYEIEVYVIDSPLINALAFPGGLIVIYSGLIKFCDNPEQLASVVAHEIGHVVNRDPINSLLRELGISLFSTVITRGNTTIAGEIIQTLVHTSFSREAEERADAYGVDLLMKANIDPQHFIDVFQNLKERDGESSDLEIPEFLSSHPDTDSRIDSIRERMQGGRVLSEPFDMDWRRIQRSLPSAFD